MSSGRFQIGVITLGSVRQYAELERRNAAWRHLGRLLDPHECMLRKHEWCRGGPRKRVRVA